jgi:hypothetical protein
MAAYPTPLIVPEGIRHLVQQTEAEYFELCSALKTQAATYTAEYAATYQAVLVNWETEEEERARRIDVLQYKHFGKVRIEHYSQCVGSQRQSIIDTQGEQLRALPPTDEIRAVLEEIAPKPVPPHTVPFLVLRTEQDPDIMVHLNSHHIRVTAWEAPVFTATELFIVYARPITWKFNDVKEAIAQGVRDGFQATYKGLCVPLRTGIFPEKPRAPIPKYEVFMAMYNKMVAVREENEANFAELPDPV